MTTSATPAIATSATALDAVRRLERELTDELQAAQRDARSRLEAAEAHAAALLEDARQRGNGTAERAAEALLACADADAAAAIDQARRDAERLARTVERHRHHFADHLFALLVPTRSAH